jgi:hypothetical protein
MTPVMAQELIRIGLDSFVRLAALWDFITSQLGKIRAQKPSSKQARVGRMVNQFKKERFPLRIIVS